MTTKTTIEAAPTEAAPAQPKARRYYIVNPGGAVHEVERDHAADLLRRVGYRMATKAEIAALNAQGGNQRADRPIAPRYTANPDAALDIAPNADDEA